MYCSKIHLCRQIFCASSPGDVAFLYSKLVRLVKLYFFLVQKAYGFT